MAAAKGDTNVDRQTTTPFHLKLFYGLRSFHHISDFPVPSAPTDGSSVPVPPALPAHLQIYTWYSCSLRELAQLLTTALPSLLPDPAVGTRLNFRLIYPDTKQGAGAGPGGGGFGNAPGEGRGRYLSKDMGSVVIGVNNTESTPNANGDNRAQAQPQLRPQGEDAEKTLQDLRFVIGDYVECAILPPLPDGSVAPPVTSRGPGGSSMAGGGMRAFGGGPYARDRDGFQGRGRGFGPGRHGGPIGRGDVPSGGWSRGERLPWNEGRGSNRGFARNRGNPY